VSLLVLVLADRAFPRSASMLREPVSPAWIFAIGAALVVTVWVGIFAYQGTDTANEVWWRFTLYGHAPRALRAAVGMSVAVLLFALARLLVRAAPKWPHGFTGATKDGSTRPRPEETGPSEAADATVSGHGRARPRGTGRQEAMQDPESPRVPDEPEPV
jgi:hypothetical protein